MHDAERWERFRSTFQPWKVCLLFIIYLSTSFALIRWGSTEGIFFTLAMMVIATTSLCVFFVHHRGPWYYYYTLGIVGWFTLQGAIHYHLYLAYGEEFYRFSLPAGEDLLEFGLIRWSLFGVGQLLAVVPGVGPEVELLFRFFRISIAPDAIFPKMIILWHKIVVLIVGFETLRRFVIRRLLKWWRKPKEQWEGGFVSFQNVWEFTHRIARRELADQQRWLLIRVGGLSLALVLVWLLSGWSLSTFGTWLLYRLEVTFDFLRIIPTFWGSTAIEPPATQTWLARIVGILFGLFVGTRLFILLSSPLSAMFGRLPSNEIELARQLTEPSFNGIRELAAARELERRLFPPFKSRLECSPDCLPMYRGELQLMEMWADLATQRGDYQEAENNRNKIDEWKRHWAELQPYDSQTVDAIQESKRMLLSDPEALQSLLLAFGRPSLLPWFGVDRQAEIARIAGRCLELLSLDRSPTRETNDWSWIDRPVRENALCLVMLEMSTAGLRETSWWRVWLRIWLGTVRYRSAASDDRCWNLVWRVAPEERLDDVDEWIVQQSGRSLDDLDTLTDQIVGHPREANEPALPPASLTAALRSLRQTGGG